MPRIEHTIDDGDGRYASRTRVNRFVYEWGQDDLAGGGVAQVFNVPLNGEIHNIILDASASKLSSNADADTIKGTFRMDYGDFPSLAGGSIPVFQPLSSLDFTNKGDVIYNFQTSEGADQNGTAMDIVLSVQPGLTAHSTTPVTPTVVDQGGTARQIGQNQPWTGRVCGRYNFSITISGGILWAADTGSVRLIVIYS